MGPRRQLQVMVSALAENVERAIAGGPLLVDVTANAFGLGLARVADIARNTGASGLYVANADGALAAQATAPGLGIFVGRAHVGRQDELRAAGIRPVGQADAAVARDAVYGFGGRGLAVASLHSELLSTKSIRRGDGVSYGYTYRAARDERTALVALGYGDGVHRHAGNRSHVLVDGTSAPIVGRVAMNVFVVSLGDRAVRPGARVTVFGDPACGEPSLMDWSSALDVEPAAVMAGLGDRVERISS
ncbi:alanine racemase C-terminal domain-containing protein [Labedella endophytica]|uniref:Alanine racemase C-terminal domain-containing protein n=1 Tax=Labedella endophytica TaxID=1523160 RepID=A0A433JR15_9MICO|nr:alanine racemase C-terminal domain-containing protein [Labedella endophytica]RUR00768.1 hypothetical protein ELQ94_04200 [Labedella endophytica]